MAALPVEWVLVIYYGTSAHRATYGRLAGTAYTKDYIQLYKSSDFTDTLKLHFPALFDDEDSLSLVYKWPKGTARGALVKVSADRPHLKWDTAHGAPQAWKMSPEPSESSAETIPGNPTHLSSIDAEREFTQLQTNGAGQPYLMAVKLRDEPSTLHLRAYLKKPDEKYAWASIQAAPQRIQALAHKTNPSKALAWTSIESGGVLPSPDSQVLLDQFAANPKPEEIFGNLDTDTRELLLNYIQDPAYGLFFDPSKNHDAWLEALPLPPEIKAAEDQIIEILGAQLLSSQQGDLAAETLEVSPEEVNAFKAKIEHKDFSVPDALITTKTRGSAQRAFADAVKANYGTRCAITGITTRSFLIASHIVPWSQDHSIRIDPSNGICLSLLVDRAFEAGYLTIDDDSIIHIEWSKLCGDEALKSLLKPYDGQKLTAPLADAPKVEYLQRRRALLAKE